MADGTVTKLQGENKKKTSHAELRATIRDVQILMKFKKNVFFNHKLKYGIIYSY